MTNTRVLFILILAVILCCGIPSATAGTTRIHIVKYANDRATVLAEQILTYQQMETTLPLQGDGVTHYYHQGPVFIDEPDPAAEEQLRWNAAEDRNVLEKDMGAVKGTAVRDLCDLVGGMSPGDHLVVKASDGMSREFAYTNVYSPPARQGPMVITWYCTGIASCPGPYPDTGYSDGMRLVFFADDSVNPWKAHVLGNFDWHESADPAYWYYYYNGQDRYPTTTGLSIKYVSDIIIYSSRPPGSSVPITGGGGGSVPMTSGSVLKENPRLYGYAGKDMNTFKTGTLTGTIRTFSGSNGLPVVVNNRIREFNISVNLPMDSNITLARMYLYISNSKGLQTDHGVVPPLYVTIDGRTLEEDQVYIDTDGDDHRYVAATYAYDVHDMITSNSTIKVSVRNLDHEQCIFTVDGVLLVTAYENNTAQSTTFWIDEGCDIISSHPEKGIFPEDSTTVFPFAGTVNMSRVNDANLNLIATGYDRKNTTEHSINFNDKVWYNLFDNSTAIPSAVLPVGEFINETGNSASVTSTILTHDAEYLVNRNAILIINQQDLLGANDLTNISSTERHSQSANSTGLFPMMNDMDICRISLDTEPKGALIYQDGRYLGKITPYTLEVKKGTTCTFKFELYGYFPAEITVTVKNDSSIDESLYTGAYSPKGRLSEQMEDPDGIQYGGISVRSCPSGASVYLDGIYTGKTTPAVINGIEPGRHTVKVTPGQRDKYLKDLNDFIFKDQDIILLPGVVIPVNIVGTGPAPQSDVIIDSHQYRGFQLTMNGHPFNTTLPARMPSGDFDSFVTIRINGSYISYPIPFIQDDDHYFLIQPRNHHNLSIAVDSSPRGAEVFIDGYRTGFSTPYLFRNISDGTHRIIVSKPGYLPQENLIQLPFKSVPIATTPIHFTLDEYPSGFLYVTSDPQSANVKIDGIQTGEVTPALFFYIPIGSHSVTVTNQSMKKTISDVMVDSIHVANVSINLNRI